MKGFIAIAVVLVGFVSVWALAYRGRKSDKPRRWRLLRHLWGMTAGSLAALVLIVLVGPGEGQAEPGWGWLGAGIFIALALFGAAFGDEKKPSETGLSDRPEPLSEAQGKELNLQEYRSANVAPPVLQKALSTAPIATPLPEPASEFMSEVELLDVEFDYRGEDGRKHRYSVLVEKAAQEYFAGYCDGEEKVFRFDRIIGDVNLFADDIDVPVAAFRTAWLIPLGEGDDEELSTFRTHEPSARDDFSQLHPEFVPPQAVSFLYENAQGDVTSRQVTVNQVGTSHFAGMCHRQGEERTFRFDRIQGLATLEKTSEQIPSRQLRNRLRGYDEQALRKQQRAAAKVAPEILFTGFKKERRAELEDQAREAGMTVRTRTTENLDFLCAGSNAGPTKLAAARDRGITVLSETEFERLLETGEVPC